MLQTHGRVLAKRCRLPSRLSAGPALVKAVPVVCQTLPVSGQRTGYLGAASCPEVGIASARGTHQPAQPRASCRRTASPEVGTARKRSVSPGGVLDSLQVSSEASIPAPSSWLASVKFSVRHSGQPWPGRSFAASAECVGAMHSSLWSLAQAMLLGRMWQAFWNAPVPPTRLWLARLAGAHMLRTLMLCPAVQVRRCSTQQ